MVVVLVSLTTSRMITSARKKKNKERNYKTLSGLELFFMYGASLFFFPLGSPA
jgi:hypothetical protein